MMVDSRATTALFARIASSTSGDTINHSGYFPGAKVEDSEEEEEKQECSSGERGGGEEGGRWPARRRARFIVGSQHLGKKSNKYKFDGLER